MELIYLDDSGSTGTKLNDIEQPLFVLGGVMLSDFVWHKVNAELNKIKAKYKIANKELHILDIMKSKDNFKDWEYDDKKELISECLRVISKFSLKVIFFKVFKENYRLFFERKTALHNMDKIPPYIVAYHYILQMVDEYLSHKKVRGMLIADEQDKTMQIAKDELEKLREIDISDIKIKNIIETSFFTSSKDSNLLQLADIVAYTVKRYLEIFYKKGISEKSLAEREYYFNIIKNDIYAPSFSFETHPILEYINKKVTEVKA